MKIQQLSIGYLEVQDRILFRIATDTEGELRLWLTFRMTGRLLPALYQTAADIEAGRTPLAASDDHSKQMLSDFRRAQSLQAADFSRPFRQGATEFPLGQSPLLVTQVKMALRTDGHLRLGFVEELEAGAAPRQFSLTLDPGLLHSVIHLLETAVRKAQWPLQMNSATAKPHSEGGRPNLVN